MSQHNKSSDTLPIWIPFSYEGNKKRAKVNFRTFKARAWVTNDNQVFSGLIVSEVLQLVWSCRLWGKYVWHSAASVKPPTVPNVPSRCLFRVHKLIPDVSWGLLVTAHTLLPAEPACCAHFFFYIIVLLSFYYTITHPHKRVNNLYRCGHVCNQQALYQRTN